MIYLFHPDTRARAVAESDAALTRLEARGYVRCGAKAHARLWKAQDATTMARLTVEAFEEWEREQLRRDLAKIKGKSPGVVYPRKVAE